MTSLHVFVCTNRYIIGFDAKGSQGLRKYAANTLHITTCDDLLLSCFDADCQHVKLGGRLQVAVKSWESVYCSSHVAINRPCEHPSLFPRSTFFCCHGTIVSLRHLCFARFFLCLPPLFPPPPRSYRNRSPRQRRPNPSTTQTPTSVGLTRWRQRDKPCGGEDRPCRRLDRHPTYLIRGGRLRAEYGCNGIGGATG